MRTIFILTIVILTAGFFLLLAYAIRTIFADFGMVLGFLATATVIAWCIVIGNLVDRGSVIVLPPERPSTPTRRARK